MNWKVWIVYEKTLPRSQKLYGNHRISFKVFKGKSQKYKSWYLKENIFQRGGVTLNYRWTEVWESFHTSKRPIAEQKTFFRLPNINLKKCPLKLKYFFLLQTLAADDYIQNYIIPYDLTERWIRVDVTTFSIWLVNIFPEKKNYSEFQYSLPKPNAQNAANWRYQHCRSFILI